MIYDEIWIDVNKFQSGYAVAARRNEERAQIKVIVTNEGKKISNSSYTLKFVGNNAIGDLTNGTASRVSGEDGAYLYTFTKENLAIVGEFKLAYFELYDLSNKKITSSNIRLRVINEVDMSADQATIHITLLDELLNKHDIELNNQKHEFDEYSTQQKDEWGNFVDSNKEILESVDPGGTILKEVIEARQGNGSLLNNVERIDTKVDYSLKSNFLRNQCFVAGHRGRMQSAPENSKISFELAGKYGLWGVETDCHETTDGKFYLYHDADLSSQTNGVGKVSEKSSDELASIVYTKAKGADTYPNTPLATLEEYLQVASKYQLFCVLELGEIKNFNNLLTLIYSYGMEGNVVLFSNQYSIAAIRKLDKTIATGLVTWKKITTGDIDFCVTNSINMLGMAISDSSTASNMNRELIDYAHARNIVINTYIVNTADQLNWCVNNHVDIITTDVFLEAKI